LAAKDGLLSFSEFLRPNLWQIRQFPKNMKTRSILTLVASTALAFGWIKESQSGPAPGPSASGKPNPSPATQAAPAAASKPAAPVANQPAAAPAPDPGKAPGPPPAAPASATNPEAAGMLKAARDKLVDPKIQSIKARILERVSIDGRQFQTEGTYVQGTDLRLRLDLAVPAETTARDGIEGSFLEVCDGTILWTQQTIGKQSRITRRDVRQILNASKSSTASSLIAVELGLGGLPALLASLEHSMRFDAVGHQSVKGKAFIVLSGVWNDDALAKFKARLNRQTLPPHVPDAVQIYLEPQILFPRRIAYLKHRGSGEEEPLLVLDFLDIVINGPVDAHAFDFSPPDGLRTVDVTNNYLKQVTGK
jgi:hypothetical protein